MISRMITVKSSKRSKRVGGWMMVFFNDFKPPVLFNKYFYLYIKYAKVLMIWQPFVNRSSIAHSCLFRVNRKLDGE